MLSRGSGSAVHTELSLGTKPPPTTTLSFRSLYDTATDEDLTVVNHKGLPGRDRSLELIEGKANGAFAQDLHSAVRARMKVSDLGAELSSLPDRALLFQ